MTILQLYLIILAILLTLIVYIVCSLLYGKWTDNLVWVGYWLGVLQTLVVINVYFIVKL
jgi:hypothetical protein